MRPCLSRRAFALGAAACAACGEGLKGTIDSVGLRSIEVPTPDAGSSCGARDGAAGWRELPLSDFPGLEVPGTAAVLQGPATLPLRTFPVVREGGALWVFRPL